MSSKDGGPIYPEPAYIAAPDEQGDRVVVMASDGMSLRDWFAGQAMIGLMSAFGEPGLRGEGWAQRVAADSYALADALLAERSKP
jgi:hypothetical protein